MHLNKSLKSWNNSFRHSTRIWWWPISMYLFNSRGDSLAKLIGKLLSKARYYVGRTHDWPVNVGEREKLWSWVWPSCSQFRSKTEVNTGGSHPVPKLKPSAEVYGREELWTPCLVENVFFFVTWPKPQPLWRVQYEGLWHPDVLSSEPSAGKLLSKKKKKTRV